MATVAASAPAAPLFTRVDGFQRAMVTAGATMGSLMQLVDTTVANVALPHMQTSLGATPETVTWILTSYIVAAAVCMPITGWLADRIGRKTLYLGAVGLFMLASTLCAMATNLPEMVAFRLFQGIAGAFLVPVGQSVILDIHPPEQAPRAMTIFGTGVVIGPILGPFLGGWLTENFNWRWCFLINIPVALGCLVVLWTFLPSTKRIRTRFDVTGFAMLAVAVGALQMMLDRGQQRDWFDSWEICIEAGLAISAGWMFFVHLFGGKDRLINPHLITDRNYLGAIVVTVVTAIVTMGGLALISPMLQTLLGYTVLDAGLLSTPRSFGVLAGMLLSAKLNNHMDGRILIFAGNALLALALWWMTGFSLDMDSRPIILTGFVQGIGMGLGWMPMNMLAFATLEPRLRTSAASIISLVRNLGGSLGISFMITTLARMSQTSHSDLTSHLTASSLPTDPSILVMLGSATDRVMAMINAEVSRQAAMVAYIDVFHLMMLITLASLPIAFLLRKTPRSMVGETPVVME
jgi:DHA2 family multidrug resistance protein